MLFALITGCSDYEPKETKPQGTEWKRIEIPDKGAIYAIHGSIDEFMLVSIYGRIWRSTTGGESWSKVFDTFETISDFRETTDTIFAVSNGQDYYSLTNGQSWHEYDRELLIEYQEYFVDLNGVHYRIVGHFEGELALPGEIEKSMDGRDHWTSIYPYKHSIYSITLDAKNRLYVGTCTQFEWNSEEERFIENFEVNAAFYYSASDLGEAYK